MQKNFAYSFFKPGKSTAYLGEYEVIGFKQQL